MSLIIADLDRARIRVWLDSGFLVLIFLIFFSFFVLTGDNVITRRWGMSCIDTGRSGRHCCKVLYSIQAQRWHKDCNKRSCTTGDDVPTRKQLNKTRQERSYVWEAPAKLVTNLLLEYNWCLAIIPVLESWSFAKSWKSQELRARFCYADPISECSWSNCLLSPHSRHIREVH